MDAAINRLFLENVVVWPEPPGSGWINLHVNLKNTEPEKNGGKPWVIGWPFSDVGSFIAKALSTENNPQLFNAWICLSQQSERTTSATTGYPKAVRRAANATWVKAIWIDVDVKPDDPKHYPTKEAAIAAIDAFITNVGLPPASAVVDSGGGFHVYWISDTPLRPAEWRLYAEGLKAALLKEGVLCDAGLTTDVARILRIPGTLNHKYSPPPRVEIIRWLPTPYRFSEHIPFIKNFKPDNNTLDPFDVPDPAFAGLNPTDTALQDGIEKTVTLLDPRPILGPKGCPWLRNVFKTGGKDESEPLWNLGLLCATFMENGDGIAHELSKAHPAYSAADTQAKYDRKVAEKSERGIGYPSCSTIAGAGCALCQECSHFKAQKSPLNIRPLGFTAAVKKTQDAGAVALLLPDNCDLDGEGKICMIVEKTVKGEVQQQWRKLFHNTVTMARVEKNPDRLHLHVTTDKGNAKWATFNMTDLVGSGYEKKLVEQGVKFVPDNKGLLERFFMSFWDRMHAAREAQEASTFGWYRPKGPIEGFSYGGWIFNVDGTQTPTNIADPRMAKRYTPMGTVDNWHHVMSYILRQQRPEFDALVATAFAAPLMALTGTTAGILACMGEGGVGKSYALALAAAVWGHHKTTVEGKSTTEKSLMNKMGLTSGLPAYWDEISDPAVQKKFFEFLQQISLGAEGGRLTAGIQQQERGIWSTVVGITGNESFRAKVVEQQKDHGAGLRRVLEYWVPKLTTSLGQVATSESEKAYGLLLHNYGGVGLQYSEYLAANLPSVQARLSTNLGYFEAKLKPAREESMWVSLCGTLLTGAELANELPTPVGFSTVALFDFLIDIFLENRKYGKNAIASGTTFYAEDYLAQYLKERLTQSIWTKGTPSGVGRGFQVEWQRLQPNAPVSNGINVRWDQADLTLRFSKTNFETWCVSKPNGRSYTSVVRALEKTYNMRQERKMLCSGTPFKVPQEMVFVIDIKGHQDLLDIMNSLYDKPDNSALGASAAPMGVAQ